MKQLWMEKAHDKNEISLGNSTCYIMIEVERSFLLETKGECSSVPSVH